MGDEVDFLPVDKPKRFIQDDSITLGAHSHTDPMYQKQPVHKIFAISQENMKDEVDFLSTENAEAFFKLILPF